MKQRLIRYKYNMVEVALALAVLAIGISSILVLFPVGINANRSAIANNNLADISEYLMGYLRAGCNSEWGRIAEDKKAGNNTPDYYFSDKIAQNYSAVNTLAATGIDPQHTDYNSTGANTRRITENLYRVFDLSNSNGNSVFLYKQESGDTVDFSAVIRVWREEYNLHVRDAANNNVRLLTNTRNALRPYATILCVEISWPAQAPDTQRERRFFRQEIFNEMYRY